MKFFFTEELSHFLGQKIQKNIFFQFYFLLKNLVTFWAQKVEKNIFFQKQFWKKCFFTKKYFFEFFVPKSD